MQIQTIQTSSSRRRTQPLVHQAYPQHVAIMRPHVGHKIVCVLKQGIPIVKCEDCDQELSGKIYNPRILECVGAHVGHELKCITRGIEVYVTCACGLDVVGSTPF